MGIGSKQARRSSAAEHTPATQDWGFYAYGDAPSAMGEGVGAFCWFETQAEMLGFVAEHLAFVSPGPADSDAITAAVRVRSLTSQAQGLPSEDLHIAVNEALRHYSQIEWWGRLQELLTGGTNFARQVRQEWHEAQTG